jgi:Protein phosphatase 2C
MKIHADCAFHIGSQHLRNGLPCQDYAIAGDLPDRAYAVVSDGCSSGGRTDVGARLISLAATKIMRDKNLNINHFICGIDSTINFLDINQNDMLATLLSMRVTTSDVFIKVQGDGVVVLLEPTGSLCMFRLDWSKNMPCYPIYEEDNFAGFIEAQGGPDVKAFHIETYEGGFFSTKSISVKDGIHGYSFTITGRPLKAVAIFSDGVTQIDGIPWQNAVSQLMSFKSTEGNFVKRRMNRFLKDAEKVGRGPIDDIAMAAIVIEDSNGEGNFQSNS